MRSPDEVRTASALTERGAREPYSVALCTYNGARFVGEQLRTIGDARPAPAETVVVDDASSDGTLRVVAQVVDGWGGRTRIDVNPANVGSLRSFERALGMTSQPIVFLADQDDAWQPDKPARLLDAFAARDDLLLVHSDARLVDDARRPLGYTLFDALEATAGERAAIHRGDAFDVFVRRNLATGATIALRRSLLDIALPIPDDWVHDEWLAIVASAIGGVDFIDAPLIDYRQHAANQIGARRLDLRAKLERAFGKPDDYYPRLVRRTTALIERLTSLGDRVPPDRLDKLRRKRAHLEVRAALPDQRVARTWPIAQEWLRGNYGRYSTGMKSIVRDLLHRP
jgi:glycosyltransferase involved in cell wall biosynthesis